MTTFTEFQAALRPAGKTLAHLLRPGPAEPPAAEVDLDDFIQKQMQRGAQGPGAALAEAAIDRRLGDRLDEAQEQLRVAEAAAARADAVRSHQLGQATALTVLDAQQDLRDARAEVDAARGAISRRAEQLRREAENLGRPAGPADPVEAALSRAKGALSGALSPGAGSWFGEAGPEGGYFAGPREVTVRSAPREDDGALLERATRERSEGLEVVARAVQRSAAVRARQPAGEYSVISPAVEVTRHISGTVCQHCTDARLSAGESARLHAFMDAGR